MNGLIEKAYFIFAGCEYIFEHSISDFLAKKVEIVLFSSIIVLFDFLNYFGDRPQNFNHCTMVKEFEKIL